MKAAHSKHNMADSIASSHAGVPIEARFIIHTTKPT
jgi:hypothetical protein